jgi:transposase-like protein
LPKLKCKDSEIIALHINGLNYTQIANKLDITRQTVAKVVKNYTNGNAILTNEPTDIETLRQVVRLEITQENTLSELANQMKDYTDQYNKAMSNNDEKAAYAWSQNRIKLIDMMAKITGLYNPRPIEQTPSENRQIIIYEMVD